MRRIAGVQCEVDSIYAFSFTDDPALGSLSPTLCSHLVALRMRIRGRPPADGAPPPVRDFGVCSTHRAIVEALDRTIRAGGGSPRIIGIVAANGDR